MEQRVKLILDNYRNKKSGRTQLNQLFEEIAEVLSPERCGFTVTNNYGRSQARIYDTTPIVAKRGLVNAISGMLRPKTTNSGYWYNIVPMGDETLLEDGEVKSWIDNAEEILWKHLYNPASNFIDTTGEVDDDLVTFGTGCGYVGLRPDMSGLQFKGFHLNKVYLDVDALNHVVGVYIREELTPRNAAVMFGEENLGAKAQERLRQRGAKQRDEKTEYVWWVGQRYDFDPASKSNTDMPFASVVIDTESEHIVEESGFEELPFFVPRWDTRSDENGTGFGRGPGTLALPSVLTLNQMGKTILRALHRAVDPPWLLPSDSMVNAPQLRPGGVSYYDAKAIRNLGLSKPFQQMDSAAQIPWGLNAQTAERESIMAIFFKNIMNLPIDGPAMTATEISARREAFINEIGSVFMALEGSYNSPMVERAFNILLRKGAFGPAETIPEALQGSEIQFRFASPVERAKQQIEEAYVTQTMDKVLTIGQVRPEVMERFDFDAYAKYIARSNDFPHELVKSDMVVQQENEMRAAQMQQEKNMATMERLAPVVEKALRATGDNTGGGVGAGGAAPGDVGGPAPDAGGGDIQAGKLPPELMNQLQGMGGG